MHSILLVVANTAYGGAERHVADLAAALARRGHRVACLFPSGVGLPARLDPAVTAMEAPDLRSALGFWAGLRRAIRDFGPDVVHLHSPRAALLGRLVVRLAAPPRPALVSTAHGWIPRRLLLRHVFEALYLVTTPLDDVTIAVSEDTARRFGGWARRLRVIPNGIALAAEPAAPEPDTPAAAFRAGFLGRLTAEKGFPLALEAYRRAKAELGITPTLELHVYGDGPLLPEARRLAQESGLDGIAFHGWVAPAEVPEVLGGLSALLLTSREEGLPYVLLEALAAGCPVVASAVGGIPEVIETGRSGWLAEPGDAAAVARGVVALARDPDLATTMKENARRRAGDFPLETMTDGVEEAYRAAIERSRQRARHGARN